MSTLAHETPVSTGGRGVSGLFGDLDFPATRDDLLRAARHAGADKLTINWLKGLPDGSYNGCWAVNRALKTAA